MIKAFIRGMIEFRSDLTWTDPQRIYCDDFYTSKDEAYDRGREFMHRVTFRLFEER